MSQLDFQSYIALFAAEMTRFSVPGIGSFVWHVERAQVDPKAGIVLPPRPTLKYEPGHRYHSETVAFIQEYFSLPADEAEALLREIGRLASNYIRATNEMDLWKLGKIKKVGAIYKVELAEDALIPLTAELHEVSLRVTAGAAVAPAPTPSSAPDKRKTEKVTKVQDKAKSTEHSRARVVEPAEERAVSPQPKQSADRRWSVIIVVIGLIIAGAAVGIFWLLGKRKEAKPVEISLSKPSSSSTSESSGEPPAKPSAPSTEKVAPSSKAEPARPDAPTKSEPPRPKSEPVPQPKAQTPPPPEKPTPSPQPTAEKPKAPSGPRHYIIVGSYPSRAEAEAKAKQFPGYSVQYLPGKDPGWVRLSIFSTTNKQEVQQKLQEVRAQVPDAWVLTMP